MKRTTASYTIHQPAAFKQQMLYWASRYNICCFLDNHAYPSNYSNLDCLLAVDAFQFCFPDVNKLAALREFIDTTDDWIFGQIGYDIKDEIASIPSEHIDGIDFPDLYFFQPAKVLTLNNNELTIASLSLSPEQIFAEIQNIDLSVVSTTNNKTALNIQPRITKDEYTVAVKKIKEHILRGDCYELNFCQEFFAENASIDPINVYQELTQLSPNPFACYYQWNNKHLLCASPERYLQKKGNRIISQPIKGTIKRDAVNEANDLQLQESLLASEKDKAENVMVVDLVRNDLSKVCEEGSVKVEELFGLYSFPQVHQLISTISGQLKNGIDLSAILQASFPMGSMTGAPKQRVMELIERYEKTKRGLYSGAVGYITPNKDFDFNVVIRSILYNANTHYLSYQVGGGITFYSDAEKEYEECLTKAAAIKTVLNSPTTI